MSSDARKVLDEYNNLSATYVTIVDADRLAFALEETLDEITTLRAENERLTTLAQSYAQKNPWIARAEAAEAALADRAARIEAAKEWRGWYASGECPSPSEWKELDRRLSVPAVPVPQDNPEANTCLDCGRSDGGCDRIADVRPKNGGKP